MSTDNAGKPGMADVPPHERIVKLNTSKEIYHGRSYGEDEGTHRK